mgnify:CR=1 FL=1
MKSTPMKTKLFTVLSLLLLVFCASCNFTETIVINEDGTGTMTMSMDGSQLMAMAGEEIAKEAGGKKRFDTLVDFRDIFKGKEDSIAKLPEAERKKIQAVSSMKLKMLMDYETSELAFDMMTDFKSVSELQDMMKLMKEAKNMQDGQTAQEDPLKNDAEVSYFYDGKKFIKKIKAPEVTEVPDSLSMYMAMFEGSKYIVNYRFPKKIKKVSNKEAVISEDRKSLTLTYTLSDYYVDPKNMGVEVEFEK